MHTDLKKNVLATAVVANPYPFEKWDSTDMEKYQVMRFVIEEIADNGYVDVKELHLRLLMICGPKLVKLNFDDFAIWVEAMSDLLDMVQLPNARLDEFASPAAWNKICVHATGATPKLVWR